jgi:response regulator RpfG family c-di-GMP phosphodiesterase
MSAEMPASRRVFGLKADGAAIKVLLIDDEEMLRSTLRRLLGLDGFSVLDFGRGSDGV